MTHTYIPPYMDILGFTDYDRIINLYGNMGILASLNDLDDNVVVYTRPGDGVTFTERQLVVRSFINSAEQTIMIRLSQFYDKDEPLLANNPWIKDRSTWMAAYLLSKRRGNEHYFHDNYMDAERELDAIATGELPPLPDIPLRAYSIPSMSNLVVDERFISQKIRVNQFISVGGTYDGQPIAYHRLWDWVS